jgi:hypothetical protein
MALMDHCVFGAVCVSSAIRELNPVHSGLADGDMRADAAQTFVYSWKGSPTQEGKDRRCLRAFPCAVQNQPGNFRGQEG